MNSGTARPPGVLSDQPDVSAAIRCDNQKIADSKNEQSASPPIQPSSVQFQLAEVDLLKRPLPQPLSFYERSIGASGYQGTISMSFAARVPLGLSQGRKHRPPGR